MSTLAKILMYCTFDKRELNFKFMIQETWNLALCLEENLKVLVFLFIL